MLLPLSKSLGLDGGVNSSGERLLSVAEDLTKNFPTYSTQSIDSKVTETDPLSPSIGENQSVTMVKGTNELGYSKPDSLVNLYPATVNTKYGPVVPTRRIYNIKNQLPAWMTK